MEVTNYTIPNWEYNIRLAHVIPFHTWHVLSQSIGRQAPVFYLAWANGGTYTEKDVAFYEPDAYVIVNKRLPDF